jgi:hypothetical protein
MAPAAETQVVGHARMLLLDDDDELPNLPDEGETNLQRQLGPEALRAIDAAIVANAGPQWLKVARVVHDVIKSQGLPFEDAVVDLHVRRVIELVQSNRLEAQGNLRKPRWSEIRMYPHPPRG